MFFEKKDFHTAKFEVSSGGLMECYVSFHLVGPKMCPLFEIAESHHAPVALDVGDMTMPSHQPWSLAWIAQNHPGIKPVI